MFLCSCQLLRLGFEAARANFHALAINTTILQIHALAALGSNVGVTAALGRGGAASAHGTNFGHTINIRSVSTVSCGEVRVKSHLFYARTLSAMLSL